MLTPLNYAISIKNTKPYKSLVFSYLVILSRSPINKFNNSSNITLFTIIYFIHYNKQKNYDIININKTLYFRR